MNIPKDTVTRNQSRHLTKDCDKPKDAPSKCVHCGENHPASYRGCSVAIELQKIKIKNMKEKITSRSKTTREKNPEEIETQSKAYAGSQREADKKTYAQVTKQDNTEQNYDIKQQLQLIIIKLNTFDKRLLKLEYSIIEDLNQNMTNDLKILCWNANGLLQHQQELQVVLDTEKSICVLYRKHILLDSLI